MQVKVQVGSDTHFGQLGENVVYVGQMGGNGVETKDVLQRVQGGYAIQRDVIGAVVRDSTKIEAVHDERWASAKGIHLVSGATDNVKQLLQFPFGSPVEQRRGGGGLLLWFSVVSSRSVCRKVRNLPLAVFLKQSKKPQRFSISLSDFLHERLPSQKENLIHVSQGDNVNAWHGPLAAQLNLRHLAFDEKEHAWQDVCVGPVGPFFDSIRHLHKRIRGHFHLIESPAGRSVALQGNGQDPTASKRDPRIEITGSEARVSTTRRRPGIGVASKRSPRKGTHVRSRHLCKNVC